METCEQTNFHHVIVVLEHQILTNNIIGRNLDSALLNLLCWMT